MQINKFKKYIDESFSKEKSIVLRYHPAICSDSLLKDELMKTSLEEGVRFLKLCTYKGVDVFLLDETTLMSTGTHKSVDGCIGIALSRRSDFKKISFSSGANTGMALTLYAQRSGIETFFFHPKSTLLKMNALWLENPLSHLITVDRGEREVKDAARIFSELLNIPNGIKANWRLLGAKCRALAICEEMFKNNINFSYVAQTVCAGFGPIGMYRMFFQLVTENILKKEGVPRFLGIQQSALSPMACAWRERRDYLVNTNGAHKEPLIEPALYNTFPSETYPQLYKLLNDFGGELMVVSGDDYCRYADLFISRLLKAGLRLTEVAINGRKELLEKAGVIAGIGVFQAIESGLIKKKAKVLCCLTGGLIRNFIPLLSSQYEIKKEGPLEDEIKDYINSVLQNKIINEQPHLSRQ